MLQQLASATGAEGWAISSMLLFAAIFAGVVVWVATRRRGAYDAVARLPLEDSAPAELNSDEQGAA